MTRAVRWDDEGGQGPPPVGDHRSTRATAISDSGDVGGDGGGFLGFATPDGALVLRSAEDVDDRGRVVGDGTIAGRTRAYLLTPLPAAGTGHQATSSSSRLACHVPLAQVAAEHRARR